MIEPECSKCEASAQFADVVEALNAGWWTIGNGGIWLCPECLKTVPPLA